MARDRKVSTKSEYDLVMSNIQRLDKIFERASYFVAPKEEVLAARSLCKEVSSTILELINLVPEEALSDAESDSEVLESVASFSGYAAAKLGSFENRVWSYRTDSGLTTDSTLFSVMTYACDQLRRIVYLHLFTIEAICVSIVREENARNIICIDDLKDLPSTRKCLQEHVSLSIITLKALTDELMESEATSAAEITVRKRIKRQVQVLEGGVASLEPHRPLCEGRWENPREFLMAIAKLVDKILARSIDLKPARTSGTNEREAYLYDQIDRIYSEILRKIEEEYKLLAKGNNLPSLKSRGFYGRSWLHDGGNATDYCVKRVLGGALHRSRDFNQFERMIQRYSSVDNNFSVIEKHWAHIDLIVQKYPANALKILVANSFGKIVTIVAGESDRLREKIWVWKSFGHSA